MSRETATQEELKDKLISPGILGLVAAAGAFALAYRIWWTEAYTDPRPELVFAATTLIEFFLVVLGLVIVFYGARSLVDKEYRVSGGVVFAGSLLFGLIMLPGALVLSNLVDELIFAGFLSSSALGIFGGLKGIYWQRSWRDGAAVPELAEYSKWALIGGLALLIDAPWREENPLLVLPSIVVLISGALVYKGIGNRRLLALLIIAGALWASNPLWTYYGLFPMNGITIAEILLFAGTAVTAIAGVKIATSKVNKLHAPRQG